MMVLLFRNNVRSILAAAITAGDGYLIVADGSEFPEPDVYDYFVVVVKDPTSGQLEIMHCTGRTGNSLAVDRAQEGTSAIAFGAEAEVSMNLTAGMLEYLRDS